MIRGFKDFIARGNVIDLAVAVVLGAAFGALVSSLVADMLTPLIAMIFGEPDFGDLSFTLNGAEFSYGNFLNATFAFLTVAAAIYFFVVAPMNKLQTRRSEGDEPSARDCPECLSPIPAAAKRCSQCTAEVIPI